MSTAVILVTVAALIAVLAVFAAPRLRTHLLQRRFGPEYDRALLVHGSRRRAAERELTDRLRLARALRLTPLSRQRTETVVHRLGELQEQFVDDPAAATVEADHLLSSVLGEVGFPLKGRADALSVHYGDSLPAYRAARLTVDRARSGRAGTEELRTALLAIRDLCLAVLRTEPQGRPSGPRRTPAPGPRQATTAPTN